MRFYGPTPRIFRQANVRRRIERVQPARGAPQSRHRRGTIQATVGTLPAGPRGASHAKDHAGNRRALEAALEAEKIAEFILAGMAACGIARRRSRGTIAKLNTLLAVVFWLPSDFRRHINTRRNLDEPTVTCLR